VISATKGQIRQPISTKRLEMTKPATMFEQYGGIVFVARFVLRFYDRVLASAALAPFFADVDMRRLVDHQAKFISSVMGGPSSYSNATLREVHAHLQIDDTAFNEMIGLFKAALEESRVVDADVATIIADLNAYRVHIVQRRARM
jgi:hemoglobin